MTLFHFPMAGALTTGPSGKDRHRPLADLLLGYISSFLINWLMCSVRPSARDHPNPFEEFVEHFREVTI